MSILNKETKLNEHTKKFYIRVIAITTIISLSSFFTSLFWYKNEQCFLINSMFPVNYNISFNVNYLSYGYGKYSVFHYLFKNKARVFATDPNIGDIAVFKAQNNKRYLQRIVGKPGDKVQIKSGNLFINGQKMKLKFLANHRVEKNGQRVTIKEYVETLPNGVKHSVYSSTNIEDIHLEEFIVPEGNFLPMVDNRDVVIEYIKDVEFVPFENLIGKVEKIRKKSFLD